MSIPDPFGTVPAPVADLTVDLLTRGGHRGTVQRLPAGHCRGKERARELRAAIPLLPCTTSARPPCQGLQRFQHKEAPKPSIQL